MDKKKKTFSIVIPVYGNEENLPVTLPYIIDHLSLLSEYNVEIIMVCDGSPDNSWEVMKSYKNSYPDLFRIYNFDKNYEAAQAQCCGIEKATGDVIGCIAADLQEPFELFAPMLEKWEEGYKLVGATRAKRNDSFGKVISAGLYHRFFHGINPKYPSGGFAMFVMDRSLVAPFLSRVTKERMFQLALLEIVDKPYYIEYERRKREIGKSGYNLKKLLLLTSGKFMVETDRLFYWMMFAGAGVGMISLVIGIVSFCMTTSRLLSLMFALLGIFCGIIISLIGMLGVSIFHNIRHLIALDQPRYTIKEKIE